MAVTEARRVALQNQFARCAEEGKLMYRALHRKRNLAVRNTS